MAKDLSIDNTPLSEKITSTIRNYITRGIIKPGDRLAEPKLAEMLGISRTPIREALRVLESEGFIEIIPRRGAIVTEITDKDVDDIFVIKIELESLAARLAVDSITDGDINRMRELNDKMKIGEESKYLAHLVGHNVEFHTIFTRRCGNDRLVKMIDGLQAQFKRATTYSFTETGRLRSVTTEHDDIIAAFADRDREAVSEAVRTHNVNGWKFISERMQG